MTTAETVHQIDLLHSNLELAISTLTKTGKTNWQYPQLITGILRDVRNLVFILKVNITDPEKFKKIMEEIGNGDVSESPKSPSKNEVVILDK